MELIDFSIHGCTPTAQHPFVPGFSVKCNIQLLVYPLDYGNHLITISQPLTWLIIQPNKWDRNQHL